MVWPAIATAAAAALSYKGQRDTNKANRRMAEEQMAFQHKMSSTAHRRQMEDLQAAGLNPILSGKLGGASTPQGARAEFKNPFEKAIAAAKQVSEMEMMKNQVHKIAQDTRTASALEGSHNATALKTMSEFDKNKALIQQIKMETAHNARDYMFLPKGISRLALKHTPFNLAGTEFYNWAKEAGSKLLSTNNFDKNDPIYALPRNVQKKLKQDILRLQMQKKNLTWDQWKNKASQVWYRHFGHWRSEGVN